MKPPHFRYERQLWKKGFNLVAGADEVGRGAFAGPVVASTVVFAPNHKFQITNFKQWGVRVDDSKKLTDKQRRVSDKWIKDNSLTWGIGEASVLEINKLGLSKATYSAFRRSVASANMRGHFRVEYLLIDAFYIPYVRGLPVGVKKNLGNKKLKRKRRKVARKGGKQLPIVNGDEKCFSIASASIIAKVYRDDLIIKLGKRSRNKMYGWERNKGYGTADHREAIQKLGTTRYHRQKFVEKLMT